MKVFGTAQERRSQSEAVARHLESRFHSNLHRSRSTLVSVSRDVLLLPAGRNNRITQDPRS